MLLTPGPLLFVSLHQKLTDSTTKYNMYVTSCQGMFHSTWSYLYMHTHYVICYIDNDVYTVTWGCRHAGVIGRLRLTRVNRVGIDHPR